MGKLSEADRKSHLLGWARGRARSILNGYMAKQGATLEGDIFVPVVDALIEANEAGRRALQEDEG